MITFFGLPRAAKPSAKAFMAGHLVIAVIAGQYSAARIPALPIFDMRGRRRTDVPDSSWLGVSPASAAAALADSYWSRSANSARILAAVTAPIPTTLVSRVRLVRRLS